MGIPAVKSTVEFSHCPQVWDVLVIGAGPAGTTAAIQLAKAGLQVLIVEKAEHPRFKVCGSCLSIEAVRLLTDIGVIATVQALHPIPLGELLLHSSGRSAKLVLPGGMVVSRLALDTALVQAAVSGGAQLLQRTTALVRECGKDIRSVDLVHNGKTITVGARCVISADGLSGRSLEKIGGMSARIEHNSRMGLGTILGAPDFDRHFFSPGRIRMFCGKDGYLGAVLLEDGTLDVAAAVDKHFLQGIGNAGRAARQIVNESLQRGKAEPIKDLPFPENLNWENLDWQGTEALTRRRSSLCQPRLLAIGDAAAYAEPFTGEGITWAIASARQAACFIIEALTPKHEESFDWLQWNQIHAKLFVKRQNASASIAKILRHPLLMKLAVQILEFVPDLATPIVTRIHSTSLAPAMRSVPDPQSMGQLHRPDPQKRVTNGDAEINEEILDEIKVTAQR